MLLKEVQPFIALVTIISHFIISIADAETGNLKIVNFLFLCLDKVYQKFFVQESWQTILNTIVVIVLLTVKYVTLYMLLERQLKVI